MILQALIEYYHRKAADPSSDMAPPGFENKEIHVLIILDEQGRMIGIKDARVRDKNKLIGKTFRVPQGVKRDQRNFNPTIYGIMSEISLG